MEATGYRRAIAVSEDDHAVHTGFVIAELMCNFRVDYAEISTQFGVDAATYFAAELRMLAEPDGPVEDGLLDIAADALTVTARGRLFVRNICMTFDRYLPAHTGRPVFSRTI